MTAAAIVFDLIAGGRIAAGGLEIAGSDRRLAETARYVEDVARLAEAGIAPAQCAHERLPLLDSGAELRGAGREVGMVQVIGLDTAFDEGAHEIAEGRRVIVDAAQQHRLAEHRDAGVDEPRARRARLRA